MEEEDVTDSSPVKEYPEGGWGWVVCAASFLTSFIVFGVHNSFGIIYSTLVNELNLGKAESAWVGSVAGSLNFLCGPIAGYLCNRYGHHAITFAGAFFAVLGLLLTSFVKETSKMYLTYGLLWGIGSGFLFLPSQAVLGHYFHRRFSVAFSIASSGSGVGGLLAAPFINYLLSTTGWENSIRILASCVAILFLCGFIFQPRKTPQEQRDRDCGEEADKTSICSSKLWRCKPYLVFMFAMALFQFCYTVPYIHLFEFSKQVGVPPGKGSWLLGILSISTTISKVIFGQISQLKWVRSSRIHLLQLSIFAMGLATVLCPMATDYNGVLSYVLVYGTFDGCFVGQTCVIVSDIVGHSNLTQGIGMLYGVIAIPLSFGPPIAGWLYKAFGVYDFAFYVAGGIAILTSLILFIVPCIQKKQKASECQSNRLIREQVQESVTQDVVTQQLPQNILTFERSESVYSRKLKSGAIRTTYMVPAGAKEISYDEFQAVRETIV
ncbi:monocarboxylate transporter 10 [Exaiptasia diaphana]|uniref:Major facilitator superfamily (MFS) profile domain-containing protein n=1 Tax=Exaiptasia diaphana TaxID=2652724 RepID=A0A913Y492_EXADI|nr:monocarboxylate transporter 10 [Exaiptasia diaphana]XP_028518849.1 monocarboxylate transporter 10 [Exaiptasia diaphana]KXJ22753.1 Monocarboxylate transporter 10 [Exaiptasia diaphana]